MVTKGDLALTGVNVPAYSFSGFGYDASKDEAEWRLPTAIGIDRLIVHLDGLSASRVHSAGSGIPLLGDFSEGVAVLPGDFNGDGLVSVLDAVGVLNLTAPSATYSAWGDLDGNGVVDMGDDLNVRRRIGWKMP